MGRKLISTEQAVLGPVELLHVVSGPAVKSRFCTPAVKTFTAPNPEEKSVVKGKVSVTALAEPKTTWPNPTTDWFRE